MATAPIQWIDLRADERRPVLLLVAFAFCMGLAQVYLSSVAITMFLGSYSASMLPLGYIGIGLTLPLIGWAHSWLERRVDLPRLVMVNLIVMALSLLLWRWLLESSWRGWVLLLYVWWVAVWAVLNLALWGLAGRIFNLRQSKRLNGVVGAGEVLAMVIGGLSISYLVGPLGAPNLLLMSVAAIAAGLLVLGRLVVAERDRLNRADAALDAPSDTGVGAQFKDRYLRLVFVNSAIAWVVFYVIDNAFYSLAAERFTSEAAMATLVGHLDAAVGALLLVSRLLLSGRMLASFGVRGGLLVIPLVVGVGALGIVLSSYLGAPAGVIFGFAVAIKISEEVCRDSIFRNTLQVLFQPLTPARRLRAQVTTESLVDPMAAAFAAVLLLLLASSLGFDAVRLFQVLLGVFVIWSILAWRLQHQYLSSLRRALARRAASGSNADLLEGASSTILRQGTYSSFPSEIAYALDALHKIDQQELHQAVSRLLGHSLTEVRKLALGWVAKEPQPEMASAVRRLAAHDAHPSVRGLALRALVAIETDTVVEEVSTALDDPEEEVRSGAVVGLIQHGGILGILLAGNQLLAQSASRDVERRRSAAAVVGEIGNPTFYHPLLKLLADEDPKVILAALKSAAVLRSPPLWPAVAPALDRPSLRGYAIEALRAGGSQAAAVCAERIADPQVTLVQKSRLVRVLGVIDDERARQSLIALLDVPNHELRDVALQALVRQPQPLSLASLQKVRSQIDLELDDANWLLQQLCACQADGELSILSQLREQLHAARARILLLLQLSHDRESMARVRDRIFDDSAERRAYAVELLDNLLAAELKPRLLPHFDVRKETECLGALRLLAAAAMPIQQRRLMIEQQAQHWGCAWLQASTICALEHDSDAAERVQGRATGDGRLVDQAAAWWLECSTSQATAAQRSELDWQFVGAQRVRLLREVAIFAQADESALARIAERLNEVVVSRGEIIAEQGEAGRSLFVIAAGTVGVHRHDGLDMGPGGSAKTRLKRIATLHAPEIFGEFALIDEQPRSALVKADTVSRLYRLDFEDFYDMLFDQPDITRRLIRLLGERLRSQAGYGLLNRTSSRALVPLHAESQSLFEDEGIDALADPLRCRLLLRSIPLLADLPDPLISTIIANLNPLKVAAGESIYREGEIGRTVYLIAAGKIRQHRGAQVLIARGARDLFGDFSILDPQPHLSSASAVEDSLLLRLDKELLSELLMLWPELARSLLRDLVKRNRQAMA